MPSRTALMRWHWSLIVATAIAHRCDYLVTWNVKHIANPNKLTHLRNVCRRVGFAVPDIVTPEYLWVSDDLA